MTPKTLQLDDVKEQAIKFYKSIKKITCPAFSKPIKITTEGMHHIERKDKKHKRTEKQMAMRYLCFLSIKEILESSKLYQEYKTGTEHIIIKKNGKKIREKRMVQYYGFVAVVKRGNERHRIRVVLKEVHGWSKIEFLSVMPARNSR